jgi:hypothetical protein
VRATGEPRSSWQRRRPSHRIVKAAIAVTAGLTLAAVFTTGPARAAVTSTAKTSPTSTTRTATTSNVTPDTLGTCKTGTNNAYEYYGWCTGTGPTSYRAIVYCENDDGVFGVQRADGNELDSLASCEFDGLDSTLNDDWGFLLCSNDNGDSTYEGYVDRHGDISWMLYDWGNGDIVTGGNTMCNWDIGSESAFNPAVAPTT